MLVLALLAQIALRSAQPAVAGRWPRLAAPPTPFSTRTAALNEIALAARWADLRVQTFDNPPGISIPYLALDYPTTIAWLSLALTLDPASQYALLMASHLYMQVPDQQRQRMMAEFVYREFLKDPDRRWPWLAHVAVMAKHRLKDLPLALRYARAIASKATGPDVPHWAQQTPIFILEDMNALESAKIELGALLASGRITDPKELHFLMEDYRRLEAQLSRSRQGR